MLDWTYVGAAALCVVIFVFWGRKTPYFGSVLLALATIAAVFAMLRDSDQGRIRSPSKGPVQAMEAIPLLERPMVDGGGEAPLAGHAPPAGPHGKFSGSAACQECHERQFNSWHDTYHRTMTQVIAPGIVEGDFSVGRLTNHTSGTMVELGGGDSIYTYAKVDRRSGVPGPAVPLVLATGSHHMQAYWYSAALGDSLGMMPFVYLVDDQRWIPREAAFILPPDGSFGHEVGRWNEVCFRCHTTGGESRRLEAMSIHETRVAEHGIACEACHGAGVRHIAFQRDARQAATPAGSDPIKNPSDLSPGESIDMCGSCHRAVVFESSTTIGEAERVRMDVDDPEYQAFLKAAADEEGAERAARFRRDLDLSFWADGMVRVSGRESTGLEDSACHTQGGMTCMTCHSMHRSGRDTRPVEQWADDLLMPKAVGDSACTQCHAEATYGTGRHTHHRSGSAGSICYNCHMPHTSYGLLKASRTHLVSSPSAAETVRFQRQNACNICHLDRSLEWTAEKLNAWFGIERPALSDDQRRYSAVALSALKGDAAERALAAWYLGWEAAVATTGGDWAPQLLTVLMKDEYNAVRYIAGRSLKRWPGFAEAEFDFVGPAEQRVREVNRVLKAWRGRSTGKPIIDQAAMDRLLRARDKSPVYLPE